MINFRILTNGKSMAKIEPYRPTLILQLVILTATSRTQNLALVQMVSSYQIACDWCQNEQ